MSVSSLSDAWESRTVGSLGSVRGGKRLPKGQLLVTAPTPHPYIRVTDMRQGGVDLSGIRYVPEEVAPAIRSYRIFQEDVFISVAGTLGIVGRVPSQANGANLTENADRITSITCDIDYLMYSLQSEPIQSEIDAIRTVGAQPKLALGRIKQFEITLPRDRAEQRRISVALRQVDENIGVLECVINKKEAIKHGIMQQLLTGKTRLFGFTGPWRRSLSVQDAAEKKSGFWGSDSSGVSSVIRADVIRAGDISPDGLLIGAACRFLTPGEWKRAACREGDVVITASGNGLGKT